MNTNNEFNLFISIGKTISKFAVFQSDKIQNELFIKIPTKELVESNDFNNLMEEKIRKINLDCINSVFICSVNQELNNKFQNHFNSKNIEVVFLSNENQFSLDLSNLYNPWELGADLIAQSIYVMHFFTEAIVVSLGTITAIYHIKDNVFSGCLFLPGISTSLESFEKIFNSKYNQIEFQNKKNLGLNTHEAISLGLINNVKTTVNNLVNNLKTKCPIIFSGGNSSYFRNTTKWWYIANLDLLGLYIFSKKYKKQKSN